MEFDYSHQNRNGFVLGQSAGPHRIITDKDKNIQGFVTRPVGNKKEFVRVPE
jgi:hypothetical protein